MKYYRVSQAAEILGMSPSTLRKYVREGKIECARQPHSNQKIFYQEHLDKFLGRAPESVCAFYLRSSSGDKKLIKAQLDELTAKYGEPVAVYQDSASGLNENRPGLQKLLKEASLGTFNTVCATYPDRLSRFGLTYLTLLLAKDNIKVTTIHEKEPVSLEGELMSDFMSLIASFSGRFYRLRGKDAQNKLVEEAKRRVEDS